MSGTVCGGGLVTGIQSLHKNFIPGSPEFNWQP